MPPLDPQDEVALLRARVAELERELAVAQEATDAAVSDARHWRNVVRSLPAYVTIFDRKGRFVYIQSVAAEYEGEEFLGRPLSDLVDPAFYQEAFTAAIERGEQVQYDCLDSRNHWYRNRVGPITLPSGETHAIVVTHNIDELKATERELHDARALWNSLVRNSPDHILLLDPSGKVLFINHVSEGYTEEELVGHDLFSYAEPARREELRACIARTFATHAPQSIEVKDARRQNWWWVKMMPVRDSEQGDLVLLISQDVTEQRQAENALRDSEARLRLLLEQAPAILWTTDAALTITSCGGAGLELLGAPPDSWLGKRVVDTFVTRAPPDEALAAYQQALAGQSAALEYIWDGLTLDVHIEPLRDAEQNIVGAIGLALDITARVEAERALRRARDELEQRVIERTAALDAANQTLRYDIAQRQRVEQELRESEERLRAIVETLPIPIVVTRLEDDRVIYVNRAMAALFDSTAEALEGRSAAEFCVDPLAIDRIGARLAEEAPVLGLEVELRAPNGRRMQVSSHHQRILFDGAPCILSGLIDLTERIAGERALRAERRLLKRLLDLHDRDRQLISYEIHDGIVQDMTAALMFVEASRPADLDETHPTHEAYASALRLLRGGIDEARRIINGLQPPVLEDQGVVAALIALARDVERDAGITVELKHDVRFERLAPALEMAIYRIVQEGLNNVWHHSQSPRAAVSLRQLDDTIELRVQDWGIGFDPTKVSKRRYGLAGMRERARLLNGRATIDSRPGAGATLIIELPLIDTLMPNDH